MMKIKLINLVACIFGVLLVSIGAIGFVQNLDYWGWWLVGGIGSVFTAVIAENS